MTDHRLCQTCGSRVRVHHHAALGVDLCARCVADDLRSKATYDATNMLTSAPAGAFECMNCGTLRTAEGWISCDDELDARCEWVGAEGED